jgi:5'-nucleotidase
MKKLTILCDVDAIVADLLGKWLQRHNTDHGDDVKVEHITNWDMATCLKTGTKCYQYLYEEGFFADLKPLPGAVEALEALHADGHFIVMATAHSYPGKSAAEKVHWIRETLPFIPKRNMMIGHQKHLLRGDVFIDDSPDNIHDYRVAWPDAQILTIEYPYNKYSKGQVNLYAKDWANTASAWNQIYRHIHKVANGS